MLTTVPVLSCNNIRNHGADSVRNKYSPAGPNLQLLILSPANTHYPHARTLGQYP